MRLQAAASYFERKLKPTLSDAVVLSLHAMELESRLMRELYAQGDLLIERVTDTCAKSAPPPTDCSVVLAEGELTGHHHTAFGRLAFFRDDGLARDIPGGLYIGHMKVHEPSARVVHQEHAAIDLPTGTYRIRRQRELDPEEAAQIVRD